MILQNCLTKYVCLAWLWNLQGFRKELIEGVQFALSIGYRLIDTAEMYDNEEEIGKAIKSRIPRNEIL